MKCENDNFEKETQHLEKDLSQKAKFGNDAYGMEKSGKTSFLTG